VEINHQFIDGRGKTRFPLIEEGIDFHGWKSVGGELWVGIQ